MYAFTTIEPYVSYLKGVVEKFINACSGLSLSFEVINTYLYGNQ